MRKSNLIKGAKPGEVVKDWLAEDVFYPEFISEARSRGFEVLPTSVTNSWRADRRQRLLLEPQVERLQMELTKMTMERDTALALYKEAAGHLYEATIRATNGADA
jgi:hypothetical protein